MTLTGRRLSLNDKNIALCTAPSFMQNREVKLTYNLESSISRHFNKKQ